MRRRALAAGLLAAALLGSSVASAAAPAEIEPGNASDAAAEEARARHRRGLELYDEGDYRLALVEFERAYAVSSNYKILYNIGQVHFQLMSYAKARLALERYLALGGELVPAQRRLDVESDLAALRRRTATLTVRVNVESADVAVNDGALGKSPLEPAVVDAGALRIHVTKLGYGAQVRDITLAGGDAQAITIVLVEDRPAVVASHGLPGLAVAGWITTGILVAGAVGTGVAALSASSAYDTQRGTPISGSPEAARSDLEHQRDHVSTLALATDALAITALVAGGVSLYLTLRHQKADAPRHSASGTFVTIGF